MPPQRIHTTKAVIDLPDGWPHDLRSQIARLIRSDGRKVVVLDDDPTGTQTVYNLPVLTQWPVKKLQAELSNDLPAFYILTNSRSFTLSKALAMTAEISRKISTGLVEIVKRVAFVPRYIIAKGGITSSDVAVHGLDVSRAMILGQILPGVPVWRLGKESRFPGLAYVVFPGNVGDADALLRVTTILDQV